MKSNLASTLRLLLLLTFVAVLLPLSYGLAHRYTFFVSRATGQNTYYVSLSGADSNPGAIDSPWRHLTYAASKLQPGDLLYIRGGNYNEPLTVTQSGTALAPITIAGYPGENVVIDPAYTNTAGGWYGVLVQIGSYDSTTNTSNGNYVTLQDLEIRNSYGMGLAVIGSHGHIINVYSHHHMENGILIMGDYGIVENSTVSFNCQSNINGSRTRDGYWASGLTAARDPTDSLSDHVILRHNKVFENWGEGLSSYEADSITMEDNVVYNNFSANIYISDTTNTTVQRNLVYETSTASVNTGSRVGIMMGDEKQKPASRNNTIINNLVYGSYRNYYWWGQFTNDGLVNDVIANNTFVNSLDVAGVQINNGNGTGHVNTIF
ncbi:MAG TPA: right-handed parallel beta-helix repeat-containing protein, partial [Patescibacteria group bacterium]